MTTCVRCGGPVPEPGLWLVRPIFDGPFDDACSQECGTVKSGERLWRGQRTPQRSSSLADVLLP